MVYRWCGNFYGYSRAGSEYQQDVIYGDVPNLPLELKGMVVKHLWYPEKVSVISSSQLEAFTSLFFCAYLFYLHKLLIFLCISIFLIFLKDRYNTLARVFLILLSKKIREQTGDNIGWETTLTSRRIFLRVV